MCALAACAQPQPPEVSQPKYEWIALEVTASAYNSVPWQTKKEHPNIAAWGDTLKPGMKTIAVSRDLLKMGLSHNTKVLIDTFPDTFYVKDKMNRRWKNRIDIYMGNDIKQAREWGKRQLQICYPVPIDSSLTNN
ncbi:3D domain-containing protein [Flagellimonas myxillae]|uniref:3D domain-containing protein n=1 Tax=Flagellimonas myxillae TaxID=2942214 RepID=UPI00201F83C8|nr:3D domain-containing protein [Muricauda myxillae]MCL6265925.1 3D domain-containing protein [Muricauda myxillae]